MYTLPEWAKITRGEAVWPQQSQRLHVGPCAPVALPGPALAPVPLQMLPLQPSQQRRPREARAPPLEQLLRAEGETLRQ